MFTLMCSLKNKKKTKGPVYMDCESKNAEIFSVEVTDYSDVDEKSF